MYLSFLRYSAFAMFTSYDASDDIYARRYALRIRDSRYARYAIYAAIADIVTIR